MDDQELRRSEKRFRALVEHASELMLVWDGRGAITYASPATIRFATAEAPDSIEGTVDRTSGLIHPDDVPAVRRLVTELMTRPGATERFVARYRRHDGEYRLLDVTVTNLLDDPDIRGIVSTSRDITEQRELDQALRRQEEQVRLTDERLRLMIDGTTDYAIFMIDPEGRVQTWNTGAQRIKGYPTEEIVGRHFSVFYTPDDILAERPEKAMAMAIDNGMHEEEGWRVRKDGSTFWATTLITALWDEDRSLRGFGKVVRDLTERKRARDELERAHDRFAALIEHGSDVIQIVDRQLQCVYASQAYERVFGLDSALAIGRPLTDQVHPEDRERVAAVLNLLVEEPGAVRDFECRLAHADDSWRYAEVTAVNRLDDPAVFGIICTARDVTERVEAAARLAHQALHDGLTGLPNRELLRDRLAQGLRRAERFGQLCAVLFVDLDNFKNVNDSLGHTAGDQVLIAVAERLREAVRPADTVARFGGDEFVILAEGITDAQSSLDLAERVREVVSHPVNVDQTTVIVECSLGIALSDRQHPDALLDEADTALQRAKEGGRNRWEIYDQAMRVVARRRLEMEQLIRAVIDQGRVLVAYQPIVELDGGAVNAAEALVRIPNQSGEILEASQFIRIAEDSGLIVPLGRVMLDQALAQQACWTESESHATRRLFVNLSARQLAGPGLAAEVDAGLSRHGLAPQFLCIELTESTLIEVGGSMRQTVYDLKDLGVSIAIDDFGTGWSSLSYLRRFPIDVVKIDQSFVAGLGVNDQDMEVTKAIIGLGHNLGLTVIAEGVETPRQIAALQQLGCDQAQGYLYGRPQFVERPPQGANISRSRRRDGR